MSSPSPPKLGASRRAAPTSIELPQQSSPRQNKLDKSPLRHKPQPSNPFFTKFIVDAMQERTRLATSTSKVRSRRRILSWLFLIATIALAAYRLLRAGGVGRLKSYSGIVVDPRHRHERFTAIAVFTGAKMASYLPLFLQTAAQNGADYDLLFVNVDIGGGCVDLSYVTDAKSPGYAPTIRHLCVNEDQHNDLYADMLCTGWGGCSNEDREVVYFHLERIQRELISGEIYNTFKPFRGLVYRRYISTKWWAFVDADQAFGSMADLLPYDSAYGETAQRLTRAVMDNFDAIFSTSRTFTTPSVFTPGQFMLFRYSPNMDRVPFRYRAFKSPATLDQMSPGDHAHVLAEYVYSDFFVHNLTDVNMLRIPDIMSQEPLNFHRRIVVAGGHLLSVDRNLPRHDIQHWYNERLNNKPVYRPTFSPTGFTVRDDLDLTRGAPCNGHPWNPSGACPMDRPTGSMRTFLYRKNGEWFTRYDTIPQITAPGQLAWIEEKGFAHWQECKRYPDFSMPDFHTSLWHAERQRAVAKGRALDQPGDEISVFEMSSQWWGSWQMTLGEALPPVGFKHTSTFGDHELEADDEYYRLHTELSKNRREPSLQDISADAPPSRIKKQRLIR